MSSISPKVLPFDRKRYQTSEVNRAVGNSWIQRLTPKQLEEFRQMERVLEYPAHTTLFLEDQAPTRLFRVVSGQVKVGVCSKQGKRLAVAIATTGEFLDLASVIIETPYCITAETIYPCVLAVVESTKFHAFLNRHPELYRTFLVELGAQYNMFCKAVRLIGLDSVAQHRLAHLLLQWCEARGRSTDDGIMINVAMTHEEIGEFIGSSRETVSRVFSEFRDRHLVVVRGSNILIPDTNNLATLAMA